MRVSAVAIGLFTLFALLIAQFYTLQIGQHDKWLSLARSQHERIVKEPARRGRFFSNTAIVPGHTGELEPFVIDVPKFHLYVDPLSLQGEKTKAWVLDLLDAAVETPREKISDHLRREARSRRVALWLSPETKHQIEQKWRTYAKKHRLPLNAVYFEQRHKRSYPFGSLLGPLLHTLRDDGDIPTGGLEHRFDAALRGVDGKRLLLRSPSKSLETGKVIASPQHGSDIFLTINHTLQAIAEEEIEKAVGHANAKGGTSIVIDPQTGHILAFAQFPSFDPARYRDYFNDPEQIEHTKVHGITDCFEMGSTMKPLTVALALLANEAAPRPIFDPHAPIPCDRGNFPGRTKPIRDVSRHKNLTMPLAIQKSSNIYVGRIVERIIETLGDAWYREKLEEVFGFGKPTGIELPSESSGMLPTPGKVYPGGQLEWSKPTPYSLAMGYNLLVTPLQVLRAWAILANGGRDVRPTLLLDRPPQPERELLPPHIVDQVTDAIKAVTKPGGTCSLADIYGYTEAAKSGTTEKIVGGAYSRKNHVSSVVGFAPAHDARLACVVVIDDPEYRYLPGIGKMFFGGKCAAPAFQSIMQRSLRLLGVPPDDPHGYPKDDPRYDPEKADFMPEVRALKELYTKLNK